MELEVPSSMDGQLEVRPQTAPASTASSSSWTPAVVPPRSPNIWAPVDVPSPTKVTFRALPERKRHSEPEPEPEPEPEQLEALVQPPLQPKVVPAAPAGPPPVGARRRDVPVAASHEPTLNRPLELVTVSDDEESADDSDQESAATNSDQDQEDARHRSAVLQSIGSGGSNVEAAKAARHKIRRAMTGFSLLGNLGATLDERSVRKRQKQNVSQSIFQMMEKAQHQRRCKRLYHIWTYAFDPHGRFRVAWDASMLGLVIYSCFYVPYKTAFVLERSLRADPRDVGMELIDWLVDGIFYIDIILNFWTGYDTGYMVVTKKGLIAKNYLKTRFPIDLVSTVEWDLIARMLMCGSEGCVGEDRELNDVTAVTRLLKVARLSRAGPLIRRLTSRTSLHTSFIDALIFFLYVLVCAHVLACVFFMVPILAICDQDHQRMDVGPNGEYIDAAYWSLTTMTTIGYGDRSPGNEPEIIFTMLAELIGLVFFVLLLDRITTVHDELRKDHNAKSAIKDEVVQFLSQALPEDHTGTTGLSEKKETLIRKTIAFLQFKHGSQTYSRTIDREGVFSNLSEALQEEATAAVFVPLLHEVRLFGRSVQDKMDYQAVQQMFEDADPDGSGELSEAEIRALILDQFHVDLTEDELAEAIDTMDVSRTKSDYLDGSTPSSRQEAASITLDEFHHWWYMQKHGRPAVSPCPDELLHFFALRLKAECLSPGDAIVRKGEYGDRLYMLMQGIVEVRDLELAGMAGKVFKNIPLSELSTKGLLNTIQMGSSVDRVFGMIGVLNDGDCKHEYERMKLNMRTVIVYATPDQHNYCECVYLSQEDLLSGLVHLTFEESWQHFEPGSDEGEPALSFMQDVGRNMYFRYYNPEDFFWGKYKEVDDYLKDPHTRARRLKDVGKLRSKSFKLPRLSSKNDAGSGDGRRLQLLETRMNQLETTVGRVKDQLEDMARSQKQQHEELMGVISGLGKPKAFAYTATHERTVVSTRPHTAEAVQHHRQLEDLMASVRAEHGSLLAGR